MPEIKIRKAPKEKLFSKLWFKNYGLIVLGAALIALGFVFFIVPHDLMSGGVYGLSIVLNHLTGCPMGMIALAVNIPLLILGIRIIGANFGVKTLFALILTSVFIDTLIYFIPEPFVTSDVFVSALFGGAIIGAGIATVIVAGATTGGTDVIAKLFSTKFGIPIGRTMVVIDGLILCFSLLVFENLELAIYSVISIIAISRVIDFILSGLNIKKTLLIISDKYDEIRTDILENNCDCLMLKGSEMFYPNDEKQVIISALERKDVPTIIKNAKNIDPNVFIIVMNSSEVIGI